MEYWERNRAVFRVVELTTVEGDLRFQGLRVRALNAVTVTLARVIATNAGSSGSPAGSDPMAAAGTLIAMLAQVAGHRYGFEFWGIRTASLVDSQARLLHWAVTGRAAPDGSQGGRGRGPPAPDGTGGGWRRRLGPHCGGQGGVGEGSHVPGPGTSRTPGTSRRRGHQSGRYAKTAAGTSKTPPTRPRPRARQIVEVVDQAVALRQVRLSASGVRSAEPARCRRALRPGHRRTHGHATQRTATGLTGEPRALVKGRGVASSRNVYRPSAAQASASSSRNQFCPWVMPISTRWRRWTGR